MKAIRTLAAALFLPLLAASCGDLTTEPQQAQAPTEQADKSTSGSFYIVCSSQLAVGQVGWCNAYSYGGGWVYPSYWSSNPAVASAGGAG